MATAGAAQLIAASSVAVSTPRRSQQILINGLSSIPGFSPNIGASVSRTSSKNIFHTGNQLSTKMALFRTEAVRYLTGSVTATEGLRFAVVVTRFNELRPLLEGVLETFKKYSVKEEDVDVRGDTTHYDAIANSSASGVLSAGVTCIFGVLTCDNIKQVLVVNLGTTLTAIEMASLFEHHLK